MLLLVIVIIIIISSSNSILFKDAFLRYLFIVCSCIWSEALLNLTVKYE